MTWTTQLRSNVGPLAGMTSGVGPLVILIHGVGLRAEAWGAQIDALSHTCRVIAVDMPGHGVSNALAPWAKLADFTDTFAAALNEPAVVIGHSFGAMIALDLAIRHPKLVNGVAALNAIYRRDTAAQSAVMARANSLDGKTVADPTETLDRWFGTVSSPQREACDNWLRATDPSGYRNAYHVFATQNGPTDSDLAAILCPTLFLTGAQEPNSTPAMSQQMAALVPNGRAEIIEDAAHMLPMTHAAQVNEILTDFVRACS
jgi:pimeloyl-ACP methyl ester carboxylesterase